MAEQERFGVNNPPDAGLEFVVEMEGTVFTNLGSLIGDQPTLSKMAIQLLMQSSSVRCDATVEAGLIMMNPLAYVRSSQPHQGGSYTPVGSRSMNTMVSQACFGRFPCFCIPFARSCLFSREWRTDFSHLVSRVFGSHVQTVHTRLPIQHDSTFATVII